MPDSQRIDPVLVEKAVKVFWEIYDAPHRDDDAMQAVIRVVFDELRLKEERKTRRAFVGPDDVEYPDEQRVRYVSEWRPVEQGDER